MNFLHYAIFLFVVSISILVGVSLMTQSSSKELEPNLVYDRKVKQEKNMWKSTEFYLTVLIITVVLALWYIFR